MAVEIGDMAPDFELKDQHGTPVTLSDLRGKKNVVLVFYPLAFSGVCSSELCELRDSFPEAERGLAARGTFIIDKSGVVRWKVVNAIPQARDLADYQKALAGLD